MNRLKKQIALAVVLSVATFGIVRQVMAYDHMRQGASLSDVHYFKKSDTLVLMIVTIHHDKIKTPPLHSQYLKILASVTSDSTPTSIQPISPPSIDDEKHTMTAIFRFNPKTIAFLDANRFGDGSGTGTYTFTITDPNAAPTFAPSSVSTTQITPMLIYPCD